ncbi:hypothetical protein FHS96_005899 [Sphingomonas zeicaulis]|uniref:hypothetical protein n=1 Tax=Sphingomonas zeicaulis TaxID=1632740 RepID=UPI003D24AC4E
MNAAIRHNGFGDAQIDAFVKEPNRASDDIDAIENRAPVLPEGLRPHVGAFLTLTPQGEMQLDPRYYSEMPITRVGDQAAEPPIADGTDDADDAQRGDSATGSDAAAGERETIVDGFRIGYRDR